ncbi:NitT/TauT family transport system permease protein [Ruminiclostridium sufflavum DSM 19573]|uniref:NitT/TauT family transport system permease protein n=1 Tax=Ruminiclostridium sufflavum DSM 19573 TaxID=1121337 RepID=A0A318XP50_9FIRM|nr:ABC transporter permease [Ruminiclostridium sufflavum]PYG87838.1 NitT/TauT family transport system permease protein [Ruminiclostridium sufflavum DSM 19573]
MSKSKELNISSERLEYLNSMRIRRISTTVTQIFILLVFFILWEFLARFGFIDPFITSQPTRIVKTIINLYNEGQLFHHIAVTCLETFTGFLSGTILGTVIAVILWWSEFLSEVSEPYLVVLNSLPKIALGPIFIVWFGAGTTSIIVIALAVSLIVTILEVLNGFSSTDEEQIKLLKTFGANRLQTFTKVVFPSNLPVIINSLKINVGLSWVGVIVGEFLVSKAGLGYLIVYGGQVFRLDLVMASVVILCIAAGLMYKAVVILQKLLVKNHTKI